MVPLSVLLIDDDPMMVKQLESAFTQEGFHVDDTPPGLDAIRTMLIHQPDLVVLGMNSQDKDWQFCHRLLTFLDRPLLLLLSTANHLDRVRGLELGADDCMIKPVFTIEVLARARALLRRSEFQISRSQRSYFVDEDLVVDLTRREVWLNGQPVALTPTEFRFLSCFVEHVGEVLSHERLATRVWGPDHTNATDIIKLYVHQLRQKLEPDPDQPRRIVTRRGEGYVLRPLAHL
jgi:DNA-binding response OmpR family regulator